MELSSLDFLQLVWGEGDCYVDLPSKAGGHWIPWYAEWPRDRAMVGRRVDSCLEDHEDLYFSAARFVSRGRRIRDVLPSQWLWADLDSVDPVFLEEDYLTPTLAWESSPGRYQCLWRLTKPLDPQIQTKLNRRLSLAIGADRGGWDLTQVLRPVGTRNFKYDPIADVTLLWHNEELIYEPGQVRDAVWRIEEEEAAADGKVRETTAARQVRVAKERVSRTRIPARARRLLRTPPEMVVVGERSGRLWELERLLADAGLNKDEIFDLVWPTPWNKHADRRHGGEEQLRREIKKALAQAQEQAARKRAERNDGDTSDRRPARAAGKDLRHDPPDSLEDEAATRGRRRTSPFVDYATFISTNIEAPRWLIEDIWSSASHGIIGGEPKTSKSTFTLAMGLSIATGQPFLGRYPVITPGPVLIIQEENAPWMMQDRLRKLAKFYGILGKKDVEISEAPKGSIAEHTVRLNFPDEAPLYLLNNYGFDMTDDRDLELLEKEVQRVGASMVIIDPLYLVMPGVNLSNSHEVGPFLQWLMALRHNHNCGVALVHHWAKANENTKLRRSGQRLMGTAFFHGWLESGLYMEIMEQGEDLLRIKVEREFRSVAPQRDLEVAWQLGEPGELDMKVTVHEWNQEGQVASIIERLLPQCDERGLNVKLISTEMGMPDGPQTKLEMARLARSAGYQVQRKKYSNGVGYVIYPEGSQNGR